MLPGINTDSHCDSITAIMGVEHVGYLCLDKVVPAGTIVYGDSPQIHPAIALVGTQSPPVPIDHYMF